MKRAPRAPVARVSPDPLRGLSAAQASERVKAGWANEDALPSSKTVWQIIAHHVFTYFNLVFCVLGLCVAAVGSWHNLLFMIVVALNTLIGIVQETRAKFTLDRLTLLSAPTARAVRDGREVRLPVGELVLDDIVLLGSGNQVCADAVLCEGEAEADESLLTGEADPVLKTRGDTLLSGSFIVSGQCRARLDKVGADSYAARITREARRHKNTRSEMMTSLDRLIRVIGILIVPFGLVMFWKQSGMPGVRFEDAVVSTAAAAVGMIPEGLYLLTSVALAVGVINLSKSKTLVHEMSCIETLARVDVLCLDKTGTITEGSMEVSGLSPLPDCPKRRAQQILSAYSAASTDDNVTARALRGYCAAAGAAGGGWEKQAEIPFSSARKWGCVDFGERGVYVLGAPECVLRDGYEALRGRVESAAALGRRVLLLARCPAVPSGGAAEGARPLALVELSDKIRPKAPETFAFFKEQGVEIKVISGDNPLTVREVARRAGVEGADSCVDARTLGGEDDLRRAATAYTVFGRVSPSQKRVLTAALKQAGRTVAMTGDGVNDVLALRDADCGIAMASGSEAAANAAQLVLLNSDFSSLPQVVYEGRRVIHNIERSASLFLVKNIFSSLVALTLLFVSLPYPFAPIQLTLISALTIGIPAFFLALEPSRERVRGRFMENVLRRAVPGGLTDTLLLTALLCVSARLGFSPAVSSAACTLVAGFTGLTVLFFTCRPFNLMRRVLWLSVSVLFAAALLVTWPLLVPEKTPPAAWAAILAALACAAPLVMGFTRLADLLFARLRGMRGSRPAQKQDTQKRRPPRAG